MKNKIKNAFRWITTKQVRDRIIFTVFILAIFQAGTLLTLPGISVDGSNVSSLKSMINLLSGGGLSNFGILALGVSPYITASIIIQLLSKGLLPYYTKLQEQGQSGRIKIAQHTRYLTLLFGLTYGFSIIFNSIFGDYLGITIDGGLKERVMLVIILAIGSLFASYLGEQIDEYGIGQGQSLIIATGILIQFPKEIKNVVSAYDLYIANPKPYFISLAAVLGTYLFVSIVSWFANKKEFKYQLQNKSHNIEVKAHYFPIKLLASSVMPVIFATSVFTLVSVFGQMFNQAWAFSLSSETSGQPSSPLGLGIYIGLIFIFSYFYNIIQVDGQEIEKALNEGSMYIVGVSNLDTSKFITRKVLKITNVGAPILVIIAAMAIGVTWIVPVNFSLTLTGVNLLIIVGVIQEVIHQIKGLTEKNNYEEIF